MVPNKTELTESTNDYLVFGLLQREKTFNAEPSFVSHTSPSTPAPIFASNFGTFEELLQQFSLALDRESEPDDALTTATLLGRT